MMQGICSRAFALLVPMLLASAAGAQEGDPFFRTYLSVNEVRSLAVDGDRFWLATGGGAVLYDPAGEGIELFHRSRDGLLSDSLTSVAIAPDGRVWFGCERAGISIFDPLDRTWEAFTSLQRPIPGDRIRRIRFSGDTLFVSAAEGYAVFVSGDQIAVCQEGIDDLRCGLPSYDVRDFAGDPAGNGFWIATAEGVAHHDSSETTTIYDAGPSSPAAGRLVRHRGSWIASFPDGAYRLDLGTETWDPLGGPTGEDAVRALLSDGERLLAAGAQGVWSLAADGAWSRVGDRSFPATSIARDAAGGFWAGARDPSENEDGLWRLDSGVWERTVFPGPSRR
ncbi:MAG: hypothetical protein GF346_07555, partial [Candidatus Eisenbacteria bacterium]|nr:hypothetical protein [Candidatus Latescibacterota bacterium]MBD3302287.1 hypothetical protein [Candidatus Eisenbacteria bacterium]